MAKTSQRVGVVLMALGFVSYFASGMTSPTALIPSFFGLSISMLGYYGRHEHTSRSAATLALGLGVMGLLGSIRGLLSLPALLTGEDVARPAAVISQSIMAIVLILYLVEGVRWLRQR